MNGPINGLVRVNNTWNSYRNTQLVVLSLCFYGGYRYLYMPCKFRLSISKTYLGSWNSIACCLLKRRSECVVWRGYRWLRGVVNTVKRKSVNGMEG